MLESFLISGVLGFFIGKLITGRIALLVGVVICALASLGLSVLSNLTLTRNDMIPLQSMLDMHTSPSTIGIVLIVSLASVNMGWKRRRDLEKSKKLMQDINSDHHQ